jgi:hypothetical protein
MTDFRLTEQIKAKAKSEKVCTQRIKHKNHLNNKTL